MCTVYIHMHVVLYGTWHVNITPAFQSWIRKLESAHNYPVSKQYYISECSGSISQCDRSLSQEVSGIFDLITNCKHTVTLRSFDPSEVRQFTDDHEPAYGQAHNNALDNLSQLTASMNRSWTLWVLHWQDLLSVTWRIQTCFWSWVGPRYLSKPAVILVLMPHLHSPVPYQPKYL